MGEGSNENIGSPDICRCRWLSGDIVDVMVEVMQDGATNMT
jgi:hypothetical protein